MADLNFPKREEAIGDALAALLSDDWATHPRTFNWPPYAFAAAATLLKKNGDYTRVLREWPPAKSKDWNNFIKLEAKKWRKECRAALRKSLNAKPPKTLQDSWELLVSNSHLSLSEFSANSGLTAAAIQILALADEASVGLGLPTSDQKEDEFLSAGRLLLAKSATLTPFIPKSIAHILPKQHTPRSGLTLRSMSHHLAFHQCGDSTAKWLSVPHEYGEKLNLVLAPWPLYVAPKQFKEASCQSFMAKGFKCFDYVPEAREDDVVAWAKRLVDGALKICDRIDGIVFPEGALTPPQFMAVDEVAAEMGLFVVAGVVTPPKDASPARNEAWIRIGALNSIFVQGKHHRWRLDRSQIEMYGLGGNLDPNLDWWEHISIEAREVSFLALKGDMTLCCLICEDLARQDPVAELVREVGPNLVIALLADAPQLSKRWPGRYAMVLADDPGSSVLTMTSLGMAQLAAPPPGEAPSRSIALWKDAFGAAQEIVLPTGAEGVVLSLRTKHDSEWTADSRDDGGVAAYPQLVGVHAITTQACH